MLVSVCENELKVCVDYMYFVFWAGFKGDVDFKAMIAIVSCLRDLKKRFGSEIVYKVDIKMFVFHYVFGKCLSEGLSGMLYVCESVRLFFMVSA